MSVFLLVREGHKFRDIAVLVPSRPVKIGRSAEADVSFPEDNQMSGMHVQLELQGGVCAVRDLLSTNGTFLNDERIKSGSLGHGDFLRCGSREFCLDVPEKLRTTGNGAAKPVVGGIGTADAASSSAIPTVLKPVKGYVHPLALDVWKEFSLGDVLDGDAIPGELETPEEFASRLLESGVGTDCMKFLAYALNRRPAVWWLIQCIQSTDYPAFESDGAMLNAALAWVRSPSDEHRRAAMDLAEKLEKSTPACWAGIAAFWSFGSLAPINSPDVPVPSGLSGRAVSVGVQLAAVVHSPINAPQRRRQFFELAKKVASGDLGWT